ncbi:hypothetical protein N9P82_00520 [bacterium]|nr:hypothetical protein [bacterium]
MEVLAGGFGEVARQCFLLLGAESTDPVPCRARVAAAFVILWAITFRRLVRHRQTVR